MKEPQSSQHQFNKRSNDICNTNLAKGIIRKCIIKLDGVDKIMRKSKARHYNANPMKAKLE